MRKQTLILCTFKAAKALAFCAVLLVAFQYAARSMPFYGGNDFKESRGEFINDCSVALFRAGEISPDGAVKASTVGEKNKLCPGEPYADQPAAAICSGVLIGPRTVLTAAHCLRFREPKDIKVVFGYAGKKAREFSLPESDVYSCVSARSGDMDSAASDIALLELDRPVDGRPYAKISDISPFSGMKVSMVGHPKGMPQKTQFNARVLAVGKRNFIMDADSFGSSSGGPVFDVAGKVIGILSQAIGRDFEPDPSRGGCNKFAYKNQGARSAVQSADPVYTELSDSAGTVPVGSVAVTVAAALKLLEPVPRPITLNKPKPPKLKGVSFD